MLELLLAYLFSSSTTATTTVAVEALAIEASAAGTTSLFFTLAPYLNYLAGLALLAVPALVVNELTNQNRNTPQALEQPPNQDVQLGNSFAQQYPNLHLFSENGGTIQVVRQRLSLNSATFDRDQENNKTVVTAFLNSMEVNPSYGDRDLSIPSIFEQMLKPEPEERRSQRDYNLIIIIGAILEVDVNGCKDIWLITISKTNSNEFMMKIKQLKLQDNFYSASTMVLGTELINAGDEEPPRFQPICQLVSAPYKTARTIEQEQLKNIEKLPMKSLSGDFYNPFRTDTQHMQTVLS